MDIVTIRVADELTGGFISAAQAIGELLISHGYAVDSVVIDREDQAPVRWRPMFLPGDRVTFDGDDSGVIGTVTEVRRTGSDLRYGVIFGKGGGDGRVFYSEGELLPV